MKKKSYTIVILSDLKDNLNITIKSAISLAKIINGSVYLFCVKKASDVVNNENQLSAIRTINHEFTMTDKKIKKIVKSYSDDFDININYSFTFGNLKNEISDYIIKNKPDVIVLGKKKSNPFNLAGDYITNYVLKHHSGAIMIANDKSTLEPNKELSLGILNGKELPFDIEFAENLMEYNQKPLKLFKISNNSNTLKKTSIPSNKKVVEYIFETGDDSIKNLSNYLSKININLLCIDRTKDSTNKLEQNSTTTDIKDMITQLNVSLLLMGTSTTFNLK